MSIIALTFKLIIQYTIFFVNTAMLLTDVSKNKFLSSVPLTFAV